MKRRSKHHPFGDPVYSNTPVISNEGKNFSSLGSDGRKLRKQFLKYFSTGTIFLLCFLQLYPPENVIQYPLDKKLLLQDNYDDENKDVTVFYNVFIPEGENEAEKQWNIKKTLEIVKEQLTVRTSSLIANSTLYYMLIGAYVEKLPNCTNCELLEYHHQGSEFIILDKLHGFCKNHTKKRVAYIHDKGSYNPSQANDLFRQMLTKSVFSDQCLLSSLQSSNATESFQCDVCSARFSTLPHFHMPGNMWVAHCSYVSKLLQPTQFQSKMNNLVHTASQMNIHQILKQKHPSLTGHDRFAAEHWLNSHPSVRPCDVYPGVYLWAYDNLPENNLWEPILAKAPRFTPMQKYETPEFIAQGFQKAEWFHLNGRIYEWKSLYGQIPQNDSWIWNYYNQSGLYSA